MPAQTIDEVIAELDDIIAWSKANESRLGYFPALYRKVTIKIKEGIADGFFDDGPRMERLDVIFANRYLAALEAYRAGNSPSQCPLFAFVTAGEYWPIVLQHLLLGMNAHINLDLGIAAARAVEPSELEDLHPDFNKINGVLASLVGEVQNELAQIWPLARVFDRFLGSVDEKLINFSMEAARDLAWAAAKELSPLSPGEQEQRIMRMDGQVTALAGAIRSPGITLGIATKFIRLGEPRSVARTIEILSRD